jgi:hypothetical protein
MSLRQQPSSGHSFYREITERVEVLVIGLRSVDALASGRECVEFVSTAHANSEAKREARLQVLWSFHHELPALLRLAAHSDKFGLPWRKQRMD